MLIVMDSDTAACFIFHSQGLLPCCDDCYCCRPRQRHKWLPHCHRLQGSNNPGVESQPGQTAVHKEAAEPASWCCWSGWTLQGLGGCSLAQVQPWTTRVQLLWVTVTWVLWWGRQLSAHNLRYMTFVHTCILEDCWCDFMCVHVCLFSFFLFFFWGEGEYKPANAILFFSFYKNLKWEWLLAL